MARRTISQPATLFYSYAQEDEALCEQLERHLSQLQREGLIISWHTRAILPGADWTQEIDRYLNQAEVILLLISPDFLASNYCSEIEMQRVMQRQQFGEARVIPILLRPCVWSGAPFGKLQALPRNSQPITTWNNYDEAFAHVAQQLRSLLIQRQKPLALGNPASQNRKRMCQRLQRWYQDYLAGSLQQAAWLDLNLTDKPEALYHPLTLTTTKARLLERPLPAGTSIVQVYEDASQELLILGEPGSGKSTQLYILAQHLLTLTEIDPEAPLPLVFALSSWAVKRVPLEQWMVEQLVLVYQVPKTLAQQWIARSQIIPLFDGLDEMEETARPQCIAAINYYHLNHLHPLVVCSRSAEYATASQAERLVLQQAVVIQPLPASQIITTLARGGKRLAGLRTVFKQNMALQELITTPLLLNLLILTYQGTSVHSLATKQAKLQQQMFEQYIQHMGTHKGNLVRYPLSAIIPHFTWIAYQMRIRNQTAFAVELLQPDWLSKRFRSRYHWSMILSCGLAFGLLAGLVAGLAFGLLAGLLAGLIVGLICGLGVGLPGGKTIPLAEHLEWSWGHARSGLLVGLVVGLVVGLSIGLVEGLNGELSLGLILGLNAWLNGEIAFVLLLGLRPRQDIERITHAPGDGPKRSLKNGLLIGLAIALLVGLLALLIGTLLFGLRSGLFFGFFFGLLSELSAGLLFGQLAFYEHYILRFWLWRSGALPFGTIAFLEDARSRHLFKRVGGTYQFIHRLLLDYFADLPQEEATAREATSTFAASSSLREHA